VPNAPAEPEASWEPEAAGERRDTLPVPGEPAAPDPTLDFEDDTSVSLDLDDPEGPTAQHHIDPEQVRAAFAVPDDEWDEEEATRQLDLGDV